MIIARAVKGWIRHRAKCAVLLVMSGVLSVALADAGSIFTDDFNRPDGSVGNGWSSWWGDQSNSPNTKLVGGELSAAGFSDLAGGIYRTLPVSFPLTFSFDFRTLNVHDDFMPALRYNDGGWYIRFNAQGPAPGPDSGLAQVLFYQYAGSRNVTRGYFSNGNMTYDLAPGKSEPIPGQRDFGADHEAHIKGTINADLSASIVVEYDDGLSPVDTTFSFGRSLQSSTPGSILIFGNDNRSFGPDLFDNLDLDIGTAVPEPSPILLLCLGLPLVLQKMIAVRAHRQPKPVMSRQGNNIYDTSCGELRPRENLLGWPLGEVIESKSQLYFSQLSLR